MRTGRASPRAPGLSSSLVGENRRHCFSARPRPASAASPACS